MTNALMYSAYHVEKLFGNGGMGAMSKILLKFMHRVIALNAEVPHSWIMVRHFIRDDDISWEEQAEIWRWRGTSKPSLKISGSG